MYDVTIKNHDAVEVSKNLQDDAHKDIVVGVNFCWKSRQNDQNCNAVVLKL